MHTAIFIYSSVLTSQSQSRISLRCPKIESRFYGGGYSGSKHPKPQFPSSHMYIIHSNTQKSPNTLLPHCLNPKKQQPTKHIVWSCVLSCQSSTKSCTVPLYFQRHVATVRYIKVHMYLAYMFLIRN